MPGADGLPPEEGAPRALYDGTPVTLVHVVRHGEVHNPERVLYGRLPGYHLSELGQEMARATAEHLSGRPITHVVSSPLERARETAAPIAAAHDLEVATDPLLTESGNVFQGETLNRRMLADPRHWAAFVNPLRPSWGEPYSEIADRMRRALDEARGRAEGREAVMVSHQLPIWTLRRAVEGRRLWHHPRRRQCSLASVTTVLFHGQLPVRVMYAEPAGHLLAEAVDVTGEASEVAP
ncbi:broad specificity phosphatase-like protein [Serinicoccus hydrothermalis]|uniref:Broad specificity phosphatase-like protein n=1 Tax=Serinicoccus hydrothermalis TaxID=1758689 RepID=A0A1B1NBK0_9MICO|nr:histidine phosphatase family protein [Serinicoccus hydrothermalis]ANS78818.1 broad specificity phosphatase-like protein [Serinicoccus hydrothermalis]